MESLIFVLWNEHTEKWGWLYFLHDLFLLVFFPYSFLMFPSHSLDDCPSPPCQSPQSAFMSQVSHQPPLTLTLLLPYSWWHAHVHTNTDLNSSFAYDRKHAILSSWVKFVLLNNMISSPVHFPANVRIAVFFMALLSTYSTFSLSVYLLMDM